MADFFQRDPKTLSVKVKAMDDEHIALIDKMNALHAAHAASAGNEEIARKLDDLASFTVKHFTDEEAYMA